MAVTDRSYDPRRLLFEVYDHHQPATGTGIASLEALTVGTLVRLMMVPCSSRPENRIDLWSIRVASVRIQDVVVPPVKGHRLRGSRRSALSGRP